MTPVSVFVRGLPPSPNSLRRQHWHQRSDEANVWKDTVLLELHAQTDRRRVPMSRVTIELVLVSSRKSVANDPDNFVAACKPLIDALVLARLISDDSFQVVTNLSTRLEHGPVTGVRIVVSPVADGPEGLTA